jgi:hypothetical protein
LSKCHDFVKPQRRKVGEVRILPVEFAHRQSITMSTGSISIPEVYYVQVCLRGPGKDYSVNAK